jgi:hypothetical protein
MIQPLLLSFAGDRQRPVSPRNRDYFSLKGSDPDGMLLGLPPKAQLTMKRRNAARGKPEGVDALGLSNQSIYYYRGEDGQVYLGKGKFLPSLSKAFKKIGKFTSPITGALAKSFLPAGVVNALAKFDPTKKGGVNSQAASTALATIIKPVAEVKVENMPSSQLEALKKTALDPKMLMIAGSGALLLIVLMMSKKRK